MDHVHIVNYCNAERSEGMGMTWNEGFVDKKLMMIKSGVLFDKNSNRSTSIKLIGLKEECACGTLSTNQTASLLTDKVKNILYFCISI